MNNNSITEIKYDINRYSIHNSLILLGSNSNLTVIEQKLLRLVIGNVQLNPNQKTFPEYSITLPELAAELNINLKSLRNEIDSITDHLLSSQIYLRYKNTTNDVEKYNLFSKAKYNDHILRLKMSDDVKDLFLQLKSNYTLFDHLKQIMTFKSKHSIPLLEALYSEVRRNVKTRKEFDAGKTVKVEISDGDLRWFTATGSKYTDLYDLKKRVISPVITEINKSSALLIEEYQTKKIYGVAGSVKHIFYVVNKTKKGTGMVKEGEVQTLFTEDLLKGADVSLSTGFVMTQFENGGHSYHKDQIDKLMTYYTTIEDFLRDYHTACQKADYNIVSYMVKMGENKQEANRRLKQCMNRNDWDDAALKKDFDEVVDYWNTLSLKIAVEAPVREDEVFYNLKQIDRTDVRHRRHYYHLLLEGETKASVMAAIDVAAASQYFLRTQGHFAFFINPKNYFDIASGERDYDSAQAAIWKTTQRL